MNRYNLPKSILRWLVASWLMLGACASQAAPIFFHVFVDTSPLIGNPAGPFALDFQLIGGSPSGNTATLSNFNFYGGSAITAPAPDYTGDASGDLDSTVTISDSPSVFFSEFFQRFTPGSLLSFDVSLTNNANTPTPDGFSFAILDTDFLNIPTSGPADSLVLISLDGNGLNGQAYSGTGDFSDVNATIVPEPGSLEMLTLGVFLLGAYAGRRRGGPQSVMDV